MRQYLSRIRNQLMEHGSRNYILSVIGFFLLLFAVIYILYYATLKIDYVWRWYKIPQYFIYQDDIKILSEIDGDITSITIENDQAVIQVQNDSETQSYIVPSAKYTLVEVGDTVFSGDTLASYKKWKPGILLQGLWITLEISFISIILGILIGLLVGLTRISSSPILKWSSIVYIELIRGSPLFVQILIWYFVIGTLINTILAKNGFAQISPFWYGVASLTFFSGAYVAEIVRAGIQSIHHGQAEASRSLGMTYFQSMVYIILPQAFRRIIPPLAGQFISLIKDSSLLGMIAIRELTKATREIVTTSMQAFELFFLCAVLYLILTFTFSMILQYVERRALNT